MSSVLRLAPCWSSVSGIGSCATKVASGSCPTVYGSRFQTGGTDPQGCNNHTEASLHGSACRPCSEQGKGSRGCMKPPTWGTLRAPAGDCHTISLSGHRTLELRRAVGAVASMLCLLKVLLLFLLQELLPYPMTFWAHESCSPTLPWTQSIQSTPAQIMLLASERHMTQREFSLELVMPEKRKGCFFPMGLLSWQMGACPRDDARGVKQSHEPERQIKRPKGTESLGQAGLKPRASFVYIHQLWALINSSSYA